MITSLGKRLLPEAAKMPRTGAEVGRRLTRSEVEVSTLALLAAGPSLLRLLLAALAARSSELLEIVFVGEAFLATVFLGAAFLATVFLEAVFFFVFMATVALEPVFFGAVFLGEVFFAGIFLVEAVFFC